MSAPLIIQPDAEAWVWANIRHLPGVSSFAYSAGQVWPGWVYAHFIQVDADAPTKPAARDTAERARQIITRLGDEPWDGGTVSYVQPVEGPFWNPSDEGAPRYTARYEIRVHPRRSAAGGAMPPDDAAAP